MNTKTPNSAETNFQKSLELQRQLVEKYEKSLPKPKSALKSFTSLLGVIGSIGSILGLVFLLSPSALEFCIEFLGWKNLSDLSELNFKDYYLIFLSAAAITWAVYRTASTPDRTSDTAYFLHRAVHELRDFMVPKTPNKGTVVNLIPTILTGAEASFNLATRKKCAVSIKMWTNEQDLRIGFTSDKAVHPIENQKAFAATKFSSISDILNNDSRSYVSNDVWLDFRKGSYSHPEIEDREVKGIFTPIIYAIREYIRPPLKPLGFRSTLVIPIRYIDENLQGTLPDHSPFRYLGFLCIDCTSRRVFRSNIITEVGAVYADVLCAIMLHNFNSHGEYI